MGVVEVVVSKTLLQWGGGKTGMARLLLQVLARRSLRVVVAAAIVPKILIIRIARQTVSLNMGIIREA